MTLSAARRLLIASVALAGIVFLKPLLAAGPNAGPLQYTVTDLGTLGGKKGQV